MGDYSWNKQSSTILLELMPIWMCVYNLSLHTYTIFIIGMVASKVGKTYAMMMKVCAEWLHACSSIL